MSVVFYFYYEPGQFPASIINEAVTANPNFQVESYRLLPWQSKWTLRITYQALSDAEIQALNQTFQAFVEYDGFGQDVDSDQSSESSIDS